MIYLGDSFFRYWNGTNSFQVHQEYFNFYRYVTKDEYYMSVTYIVPDDSQYLRSHNMRQSDLFRMELNDELKRNIWAYLNVRVIINSTGIRSESYNERVNESDTKQNDAIQKLNKFFL